MNWRKYYNERKISIDDAAAMIQNNDVIVYGHAACEARLFAAALMKREKDLSNVKVIHGVSFGPGLYCQPEIDPSCIQHVSLFAAAQTRKAVQEGRASFAPMHFSDIPTNFQNGLLGVTVSVLHVSKPNEDGLCSLGVGCDYEKEGKEAARLVIAEVNEQMPRTYGDTFVHVSEIDYFVETDESVLTIGLPVISDVEKRIAAHISELIEDGACLQLGIGGVPNAIMEGLKTRNDLGIHTEMLSDSAMDLIKSGVVTNKKKSIHQGVSVATFAAGSKEFYDWINENSLVELHRVQYINDPRIIAANDHVLSVNSALQVDLMGQVVAETVNGRQFSGIGGQMDFVRGANWSKGGKSIIAMPAGAKGDTISRIVAAHKAGDAVTTPRTDVDYIVTEFGSARLKGRGIADRARLLIEIAHPNFRDQLKDEFKEVYGYKL